MAVTTDLFRGGGVFYFHPVLFPSLNSLSPLFLLSRRGKQIHGFHGPAGKNDIRSQQTRSMGSKYITNFAAVSGGGNVVLFLLNKI